MRQRFGDDWARIAKLSIIEETATGEKTVRMAYLAVIASSHVNGVAKIHSGGWVGRVDGAAGAPGMSGLRLIGGQEGFCDSWRQPAWPMPALPLPQPPPVCAPCVRLPLLPVLKYITL